MSECISAILSVWQYSEQLSNEVIVYVLTSLGHGLPRLWVKQSGFVCEFKPGVFG